MSTDNSAAQKMNKIYQWQVKYYDFLRKYYLLGRDQLFNTLHLGKENICEIGCGTGRNLIYLAARYPEARFLGIDVSTVMTHYAEQQIRKNHLEQRIQITVGDALSFTPHHAFDRIIFSYVLSMVPHADAALKVAIASLKPGGVIHIIDFGDHDKAGPIMKNIHQWWLSLFSVFPNHQTLTYLEAQQKLGLGTCERVCSPTHYYEVITFRKY